MPEISRFFGIVIKMYYNDHQPPHFHAEYGEYLAEISIDSLNIIHGDLPWRALVLVLEWAHIHRQELLANWTRARERQNLLPVEPLE